VSENLTVMWFSTLCNAKMKLSILMLVRDSKQILIHLDKTLYAF
jgi:hypothetical protein